MFDIETTGFKPEQSFILEWAHLLFRLSDAAEVRTALLAGEAAKFSRREPCPQLAAARGSYHTTFINPTGNYDPEMNPAAFAQHGITKEHLRGQPFGSLFPHQFDYQ